MIYYKGKKIIYIIHFQRGYDIWVNIKRAYDIRINVKKKILLILSRTAYKIYWQEKRVKGGDTLWETLFPLQLNDRRLHKRIKMMPL